MCEYRPNAYPELEPGRFHYLRAFRKDVSCLAPVSIGSHSLLSNQARGFALWLVSPAKAFHSSLSEKVVTQVTHCIVLLMPALQIDATRCALLHFCLANVNQPRSISEKPSGSVSR